jgi:hypothetical protein
MAFNEPGKYQELLENQIIHIFRHSGLLDKLNLQVKTGYANTDEDLIISDIILGSVSVMNIQKVCPSSESYPMM